MPHSGLHILRFWNDLVLETLPPSWVQNDAQHRPSGTTMASISQTCGRFFRNLEETCCQGRFLSAPWHHLGRFWMDFACILMDCCILVDAFRTHFCNKICRLPTSPDTKRIDSKHQEHADICRNMQRTNANKKRRHQKVN